MEIEGRGILILGGSGLVGRAIARRLLSLGPGRLVIGSLREEEARGAVEELRWAPDAEGVELIPEWGNIFFREEDKDRSRQELLADPVKRAALLEDLFGPMEEEAYRRSCLFALLERHRPAIVFDCINTATAIAYQEPFGSADRFRSGGGDAGHSSGALEAHLAASPLPQLTRHVQILLGALRRIGTRSYVKVGTSGTGGMGLNVPFTHSEERPSRELLAKASVAGAHSALLFLMGRTPGAPAIAEIKPSAAIAWKRIGHGPVLRAGRPIPRYDATSALPLEVAFEDPGTAWEELGEPIESVFLDAGENGMFSLSEFETISALGLMEVVTPEEIAEAAIDEVLGRPTGRDVVAALDGATFGPTYRGGMLRDVALDCMERLEREHGVRSVAFEMLGPRGGAGGWRGPLGGPRVGGPSARVVGEMAGTVPRVPGVPLAEPGTGGGLRGRPGRPGGRRGRAGGSARRLRPPGGGRRGAEEAMTAPARQGGPDLGGRRGRSPWLSR